MTTDHTTIQQAAEFPTDEHRKSHMAALVRERKAYEARADALEKSGDSTGAEQVKARATQVADELKRLADSARPRRGATR